MKQLLLVLLTALSLSTTADEIRFLLDPDRGEPFVFSAASDKTGLVIDIGSALATRLNLKAMFISLPRKRHESFITGGKIDAVCLLSPSWYATRDQLAWSKNVYSGYDVFVTAKPDKKSIVSYGDLAGKAIGTRAGYFYAEPIMQLFETGKADRVDLQTYTSRYQLLDMGRIATFIDSEQASYYQMTALGGKARYTHQDFKAEEYPQACALNKGFADKVGMDAFNKAIDDLIGSGMLQNILQRYR
ncbi:MAG: transporter substrate-binding domain-containing protein [Hahellaceae bacterium]|nr:transporter substrate-binding domain-containing protein [Hahellaceae bacterium]MCP5211115.1 transporter substrate-binding domain-containing protein [Hahellaceae bacterium]